MSPAYTKIVTEFGPLIIYVWPDKRGEELICLTTENLDVTKNVLVRVHSECFTGDMIKSKYCDCGLQKDLSLKLIARSKNGLFIYHRAEGRGIGLFEKIKAYKLRNEKGIDTYTANVILGWKPDERNYSILKKVFSYFNIKRIILLTNNPSKINQIKNMGISVVNKPLITKTNKHNIEYIKTKIKKFGHTINLK